MTHDPKAIELLKETLSVFKQYGFETLVDRDGAKYLAPNEELDLLNRIRDFLGVERVTKLSDLG